MKFEMKTLVAAVALAAAGIASAAPVTGAVGQTIVVKDPGTSGRSAALTLLGGTGTLQFSNGVTDPATGLPGTPSQSVGGLVGALNVGDVQLTKVGDATTIDQVVLPIGVRTKTNQRAIVKIGAAVTSITGDDQTGVFSTVTATGGAIQSAAAKTGVLEGGNASVTNLRIDLIGKRVFADLLGNPGTEFASNLPNTHLWNFANISGPTSLPPAALLAAADGNTSALTNLGYEILSKAADGTFTLRATNLITGLSVTQAGFDFFADALGLTPGSTGRAALEGVKDWGGIQSSLTFTAKEVTAVVPEPSTYAMLLAGLAGVGLVARRRNAAK